MHIAILGGGITALSTAWSLIECGHSVTICSQQRPSNASNAAGGMLSPSCEADGCEAELIRLSIESCRQYPKWVTKIEHFSKMDCGFCSNGTLLIALHHDHNQELEHLVAFQKTHALPQEWLTRKGVKRKSPNLSRHIGGLWFADDHFVNPRLLTCSLKEALINRGAQFIYGSCKLETENDNLTSPISHLRIDDKRVSADSYVLADGAWSLEHLPSLPLRPVKGQYIILAPKNGTSPLIDTVIRTPDVYIIPRANGQLYIGATMEEEDFDTRQTAGATLDLLYHAFQVLPAIYEMVVVENGQGFRPALRDNQPMIGQSQHPNMWLNIGHYRHGIMLAPAAGALLANALTNGTSIPETFSTERFRS